MSDLVEALRYEGMLRVGEKEMVFGDSKSRADRVADDICYQAADEIERLRRHIEVLQEKDASECGCGIDRPDDVCLYHSRLIDKARRQAFIEAAEVAEAGDWHGQHQTRGDERRAQAIAARIRARAEETKE